MEMDGQRFDNLAKLLAAKPNRRQVIKGLGLGAVAAAFGLRGATIEAAPTCRALGEACKPGPTGTEAGTCCTTTATGTETHLFCQQVAETGAQRCECATGFVACGGQCVSISCPG